MNWLNKANRGVSIRVVLRISLLVSLWASLILAPTSVVRAELTVVERSNIPNPMTYLGSEACKTCHENEYSEWKTSQHFQAMSHASEETVLADFNDVEFIFDGKVNRFFKKGEEFWVNIMGRNGVFHDYQIKYTFGVYPLQQYMVEFEDGRVQLIPFTWDSRTHEEGGQRWYHLYPNLTSETDEFFWLNQGQNWNYMCADCHSTNLRKNYDKDTNRYNTTWSEISVGCEACHGEGSLHSQWVSALEAGLETSGITNKGFDRDLSKVVSQWDYQQGKSTFVPVDHQETDLVRTCAQCHSRRTLIAENDDHVRGDFLDRHLLTLVNSELYHKDGQIYDENYVYGSFMQSKMHQAGVTCTNCHNPHSGKTIAPEPALCYQCHSPADYTPEKHSKHSSGLGENSCSSCHMVEELYMQVDRRKDHGWHIPRPDLSVQLGTPNACTSCHEDKDNKWALEAVTEWFPDSKIRSQPHFAHAFYAADNGDKNSADLLYDVVNDVSQPAIIRASALERMQAIPQQKTIEAIQQSVKDEDAMVRLGAIHASQSLPGNYKWPLLNPLLADPVLSIRIEAAAAFIIVWQELTPEQQKLVMPSLKEYEQTQLFLSDRGAGRTNLGNLYRAWQKYDEALAEYKGSIDVEPFYSPAYVNLADLYRKLNNNSASLNALLAGREVLPKEAALAFATGLAYVRVKDLSQAVRHLEDATQLDSQNAHYYFVLGLALEGSDVSRAKAKLKQAYMLSGDERHLQTLCDFRHRHEGMDIDTCIAKEGALK